MKVQVIYRIKRGNMETHPVCVVCVHIYAEMRYMGSTFSYRALCCGYQVFWPQCLA